MLNPDAVLAAREERWKRRLFLAGRGGQGTVLLSLTLRMPAFLRTSGKYHREAELLFSAFAEEAARRGMKIVEKEYRGGADGPECHLSLRENGEASKAFAVFFEETHPWGALVDADVMTPEGIPLSRRDLGIPERRCLVCGGPAAPCAAGRTHSPGELEERIRGILAHPFHVPFPKEGAK